jgi:ABC-type branched-subunit amino acid transport system ATPase component/ABC-type branched-subunit amino acid transport system permease subunit
VIAAIALGPWDASAQTLVVGALTGLAYGLLAAGLVLVYRATRVINFAHGQIGALGAAVLAKIVIDWHWNFFLALAGVLVVGGLLGAVVELGVVRRLFDAPRTVLLVATIGVSQLIFVLELALPDVTTTGQRYPTPIDRTYRVGDVFLGGDHIVLIAIAPAAILALGWFVHRTWFGIALRASADNPDRAELIGISTRRVSTLVWVLAGVLSTLTAVLLNPVRGAIVGLPNEALGPGLLLRALAAALIGRLMSLPLALAGGLAIGVGEAIVFANVTNPGTADLLLFITVLGLVLARGRASAEHATPWSLHADVRPVPPQLRRIWWIRHLSLLTGTGAVAVAVVLPLVFTSSARAFLFSTMLLMALVGLSVSVLTGWAGQLSLGQFAFVGLGAMTCGALHSRGVDFVVAVGMATVAGIVAAVLTGFPALRVSGLSLAVTTLAFAVAARSWLFAQPVLTRDASILFVPRSRVAGIDLRSQRAYYYLCLVVLVLAAVGVARLRSSGIGRSIIATRDNEAAAASFTLSPAVAKVSAFGFAGGLASLAGALFAGLWVQYNATRFGPEQSLQIVSMTIIGGLGTVAGPVLGALYVVGLPALFDDSGTVRLATSGIGLLLLLLYLPGGLVQLLYRARAAIVDRVARSAANTVAEPPAATRPVPARRTRRTATPDVPAFHARGITVRFDGRTALDQVDVRAERGEIVGLIGANGAGKSTLLNVASGFITPQQGVVEIGGVDVTRMPAHRRARLGVGRIFQDARLFGALTVSETVAVALEADERSELVPALLGLPPARRAEARKAARTADCVDLLGLGPFADHHLDELSTGTRRIVELCCLLAQGADLLLLDEPTAGVAQRETEAFGPLLRRIQAELAATILVIEHDIPLVTSISDRVYCLAAGQVIAAGDPLSVRTDPAVVAAYLGTDERAIARSDAAVPAR